MNSHAHTMTTVAAIAGGALLAMSCSNEPTTPRQAARGLAPLYEVSVPSRAVDRYIVVLVDTVKNVIETAHRLADAHGGVIAYVYEYVLHGFSVTLPAQAIDVLRTDPAVRYVQQVEAGQFRVASADPVQVNPPWGLDRIDDRAGLEQRYSYWETGSGVHVYIVDTGILTAHTEFGGRASVGFDARPQDGLNGQDCFGHGTHVAGIAGGQTYGVAKSASLVAVKVNVACADSIDPDAMIAGVNWVAGNRITPAVANMSIQGPPNASVDQAVSSAIGLGVTFAVAAGNYAADACNVSPARVAQAITVGATTSADARAAFSDFGTCVRIFAPGQDILSAWSTSSTATMTLSGTSMASPHVAGTVARYLQYKPTATPSDVSSAISSRATQGALTNIGTGSPNLLLYSWFVDASISGPTSAPSCGTYTWVATASGIGSSFTFVWERGVPTGFGGGIFWQQVGTGPSYPESECPGYDSFYLRVTATNEFGHHRQAYIHVVP